MTDACCHQGDIRQLTTMDRAIPKKNYCPLRTKRTAMLILRLVIYEAPPQKSTCHAESKLMAYGDPDQTDRVASCVAVCWKYPMST